MQHGLWLPNPECHFRHLRVSGPSKLCWQWWHKIHGRPMTSWSSSCRSEGMPWGIPNTRCLFRQLNWTLFILIYYTESTLLHAHGISSFAIGYHPDEWRTLVYFYSLSRFITIHIYMYIYTCIGKKLYRDIYVYTNSICAESRFMAHHSSYRTLGKGLTLPH